MEFAEIRMPGPLVAMRLYDSGIYGRDASGVVYQLDQAQARWVPVTLGAPRALWEDADGSV